ncbi:MAG: glycosyltransferase [Lamprobacter sp.]|uniref:glycosyltransferase n=1 Tax=Lamprobacter sp. TaxID=3100796 RepID=UPI002B26375D|nr:glycosyltransferase [Lamprobacter sp.]MEA3639829.1 glycosyltransferase [Lamprobacter sp.]
MSDTAQGRAGLVSVIMPSFNTAAYIGEAIDSVLAQDYPNKELIVIDDGSTDTTVERIRSYGDQLRLITQANQGSAVARNQGLQAAQGDYIAFLDSDDLWLPGKLSAQVAHLQRHPEIDMVFSRWQVWKPDPDGAFPSASDLLPASSTPTPDSVPGIVPDRSGWLYNRLLFSSLLHTITVMARRSLIERVGLFDTSLKRGQDYDYWIRASRLTQMHQLDRVFALYRLHGHGCVHRWPTVNYEGLVVNKAVERFGLIGPTGDITPAKAVRRRVAETSFTFGYHHFWSGQARIALRAFAQVIAKRPLYLKAWPYLALAGVKSLLPQRIQQRWNRQRQ